MVYFKINTYLFCYPLFFKQYLNPKVMINKVLNEHSVAGSKSSSHRQRESTTFPEEAFFQNLFPSAETRRGGKLC